MPDPHNVLSLIPHHEKSWHRFLFAASIAALRWVF
ncbi:HNH endonuclease [Peribacillus frigoritolerans]